MYIYIKCIFIYWIYILKGYTKSHGEKMTETIKEWTSGKPNSPKKTGQNDWQWTLNDKWKFGFLKNEGIL